MAEYQSLGQELECPICLEYPENPKVMGKCLHAACLECLEKLVDARNTDFFPCPVCREECTIPPKGVGDLKDDFRLRALVEKLQKIKVNKTIIPCTACPKPASHFCKECDKIFLCLLCSRKHNCDPLTTAHKLYGLCREHGKRLTLFCRKCNTPICSACRIANHPSDSQEHDVIHFKKAAAEEGAEMVAAIEMLDITREQKKELKKIEAERDRVIATMNSDLVEFGKQSDSAIEYLHTKHCELKAESSSIQEQVEALMRRKQAVDLEVAQTGEKESLLFVAKETFSKYLHYNRDRCIKEFVEMLARENDKTKAMLDFGRTKTTLERVLDPQTIPSLRKLKSEVRQAVEEKQNKVDLSLRIMNQYKRYVPSSTPGEIGFLQPWRIHLTKMSGQYPLMNKFAEVSYPAGRPCKSLYSIRYLPDGRLASLYRSGNDFGERADTITVHDPASPVVPLTVIDQNIQPGLDMTVTTNREIMVLRLGKPSVRVFRNDGVFQPIDLNIGPHVISDVRPIEADEAGNIFVGKIAGCLRVFTPDGENRQEAKPHSCSLGEFLGMSYDRPTRNLYVANVSNILKYLWDGRELEEISSDAHGVYGFRCTDVCINDGRVFAAGVMCTTREIRIYQVVEAEKPVQGEPAAPSTSDDEELYASGPSVRKDDDRFEWIRLNFGDNTNRTMPDYWKPIAWITVFGNTLALGYQNKVELFHLNP